MQTRIGPWRWQPLSSTALRAASERAQRWPRLHLREWRAAERPAVLRPPAPPPPPLLGRPRVRGPAPPRAPVDVPSQQALSLGCPARLRRALAPRMQLATPSRRLPRLIGGPRRRHAGAPQLPASHARRRAASPRRAAGGAPPACMKCGPMRGHALHGGHAAHPCDPLLVQLLQAAAQARRQPHYGVLHLRLQLLVQLPQRVHAAPQRRHVSFRRPQYRVCVLREARHGSSHARLCACSAKRRAAPTSRASNDVAKGGGCDESRTCPPCHCGGAQKNATAAYQTKRRAYLRPRRSIWFAGVQPPIAGVVADELEDFSTMRPRLSAAAAVAVAMCSRHVVSGQTWPFVPANSPVIPSDVWPAPR
jgi:hypothetical protein